MRNFLNNNFLNNSLLNNKAPTSKTGNTETSSRTSVSGQSDLLTGTDRDTAKEIFGDPVGYLASLGVNATLVETRRLPAAA